MAGFGLDGASHGDKTENRLHSSNTSLAALKIHQVSTNSYYIKLMELP